MTANVSRMTSAAVLWLAASALAANAQTPFLDAVHVLATTATAQGHVEPEELIRRRTAALARITTTLAEWDRGLEELERRVAGELRTTPPDGRTFQLRVELGLAYRRRGRLADALREFDAAAAAQPGASDLHVLRALTLDAAGRTTEAGQAFRTAWLRDAANPIKAYLALRPVSGLAAGERERARQALSDAFARTLANGAPAPGAPFQLLDPVPDSISRTPVVADAVMATVFARLSEGRLDAAVEAVRSSPTATPDHDSPLAQFERGRVWETEGRHADARRAYAAALTGTLAGRHALHVGIGRLAQVDGDLDAAIEAFGHAARLHPNDPVIHRELAGAYAAAGRVDEAFAELTVALLIDPRDVDALVAAGHLLLARDRAADAVAALGRAVEVNPDRVDTHYALAVALARAGRTEESARQFERVERMSRQALDQRRRAVTGQAAPDPVGK